MTFKREKKWEKKKENGEEERISEKEISVNNLN